MKKNTKAISEFMWYALATSEPQIDSMKNVINHLCMTTNNFYRIRKNKSSKISKFIFTLAVSALLYSCTNHLDKWFKIDNKKAALIYNDREYIDFDFVNQHDTNLPTVDSLYGVTKFIKADNKIKLGFKIRILLKGKYDMYQIKFGFKFLDKDGFLISDFVENLYNLCPPNKTISFQDKIETKLTDEQLKKINSVAVKLIISDVKSSKERYEQNKTTK
jgi:hypothetical protein